jgi:hypothetical protein
LRLAIGDEVPGTGARYAQLDGEGAVFIVPNAIADALREEYR